MYQSHIGETEKELIHVAFLHDQLLILLKESFHKKKIIIHNCFLNYMKDTTINRKLNMNQNDIDIHEVYFIAFNFNTV